jgi:hypothetical protein
MCRLRAIETQGGRGHLILEEREARRVRVPSPSDQPSVLVLRQSGWLAQGERREIRRLQHQCAASELVGIVALAEEHRRGQSRPRQRLHRLA